MINSISSMTRQWNFPSQNFQLLKKHSKLDMIMSCSNMILKSLFTFHPCNLQNRELQSYITYFQSQVLRRNMTVQCTRHQCFWNKCFLYITLICAESQKKVPGYCQERMGMFLEGMWFSGYIMIMWSYLEFVKLWPWMEFYEPIKLQTWWSASECLTCFRLFCLIGLEEHISISIPYQPKFLESLNKVFLHALKICQYCLFFCSAENTV